MKRGTASIMPSQIMKMWSATSNHLTVEGKTPHLNYLECNTFYINKKYIKILIIKFHHFGLYSYAIDETVRGNISTNHVADNTLGSKGKC